MGFIKLIFVGAVIVALAAQVLAAPKPGPEPGPEPGPQRSAKTNGCKDCLSRCIQKDEGLDCPDDPQCLTCYKELIVMDEGMIQEEKAEVEQEKNELNNMEAALANRTSKRTADQTIVADDNIQTVKKEIADEVEKVLKKRWVWAAAIQAAKSPLGRELANQAAKWWLG